MSGHGLRSWAITVATAVMLGAGAAVAQGMVASPAESSRLEVADALRRFERSLAAALERAEDCEAVLRDANRRFDQLSLAFFTGRLDPVRDALDQLTADLRSLQGADRERFLARARLRAGIHPRLLDAHQGTTVRITLSGPPRESWPSRAVATCGSARVESEFSESGEAVLDLPPAPAAPAGSRKPSSLGSDPDTADAPWTGRWVISADDTSEPLAFAAALPMSPADLRSAVLDRWQAIDRSERGSSLHAQSRAAIRSRVELLASILAHAGQVDAVPASDAPAGASSPRRTKLIEHLVDPTGLAIEVVAELDAIEAGIDLYAARDREPIARDLWRELDLDGVRLPMRTFVPAGAAPGARPLIIAFHGAGGDENMFMEAYGSGVLRRMAVEHGAVVVSPRSAAFGPWPTLFDAIVDEMVRCHGIDRHRVVVLGHSMGTGVVATIVNARPEALAAAAMIAGAGAVTIAPERQPPLRIDAGELDPIIPAARIARMVGAMRDRGLSVDFREHAGRGHTLIVGELLPEVVRWLLSKPPSAGAAQATEPRAPERNARDGDADRKHAPDIREP